MYKQLCRGEVKINCGDNRDEVEELEDLVVVQGCLHRIHGGFFLVFWFYSYCRQSQRLWQIKEIPPRPFNQKKTNLPGILLLTGVFELEKPDFF
jgi:hypothetical protein